MNHPSMEEAAQIRDVAERHAYVFDNGLSSPDFFDVAKRMASEEFGLLRERIAPHQSVLEIGCFTGLNLLGLERLGYVKLTGVDFVAGAIEWLESNKRSDGLCGCVSEFPATIADGSAYFVNWDFAVCFDVLEHQLNVGRFLEGVSLSAEQALFLVPVDKHYFDCGHVAFFPDAECLRNVLDYYFDVEELFELKTCRKLFASCKRRS